VRRRRAIRAAAPDTDCEKDFAMNQTHETHGTARRRALVAGLLATTILAGGVGFSAWSAETSVPAASAPAVAAKVAPLYDEEGFAPLVDQVRPAVVNIATTEKVEHREAQPMPEFPPGSPFAELFKHFYGQDQDTGPRHALGSGFIVDADGTIVTNNHVIKGATKIMVTLDDGTSYPATVKGHDDKTDIAVLKIDAKKPLAHLAFGDSDRAKVGNWVIAVGNPFGLGGTVTAGIVSAHGRDLNSGPYDNFIQIDAPINPGNSGGPLFNQKGEVIGIDTAIYSPSGGSVGIGFAIPSNLVKPVVAQLREHGEVERGWLGVQMQPLSETLAKAMGRADTSGVLVDQVMPDSPAKKAGLKQGDLITEFEGKPVKDPRDMAMDVAGTSAGTTVKLTVVRDGKEQNVDVAIAKQQAEQHASADKPGEGPIGLALAPLSPENRDQLGLDESVQGVVVERVAPDSRAAESGVHPGDVIVKIGTESVRTPAQAVKSIEAAQHDKKEAVPLLVMRDGNTYYLALQLTEG
jgi:serine protease Do